jgi:hypothetical protein
MSPNKSSTSDEPPEPLLRDPELDRELDDELLREPELLDRELEPPLNE